MFTLQVDPDEVFLVVGGVMTSVLVAIEAQEILQAAPGLMVRQPLARYKNPLAMCDYHGEAAPYREQFYASLAFHGRGAAGRPATKHAFMYALEQRTTRALAEAPLVRAMPAVAQAYAAMSSDVSYVMAMAKMANTLLARQQQWRERSEQRRSRAVANP